MTNVIDFKPKSDYQITQELANLLPDGEVWKAKNIEGSNFRKDLQAESLEFKRFQTELYGQAVSLMINKDTSDVLPWEKFLGIPDSCFNLNFTEEQRRINCQIKFGKLYLRTRADYEELASLLNVKIIDYDVSQPWTLILTVEDLQPDNIFDLDFSPQYDPIFGAFLFGSLTGALFECLVRKYRRAPYDVQFIVVEPTL